MPVQDQNRSASSLAQRRGETIGVQHAPRALELYRRIRHEIAKANPLAMWGDAHTRSTYLNSTGCWRFQITAAREFPLSNA